MLSARLQAIADMVQKDMVVADIGCDHAFLPVSLVQNKVIQKAYAIDNKEGPLLQAKRTISENHLCDSIIPLLQDGLENLPEDVTCVILAGMGAELMIEILNKHPQTVTRLKEIIVQPNTNVFKLREYINEKHYTILDETIVYEYKYYPMIRFALTKHAPYTTEEILFGPCLLHKNSKTFQQYLFARYQKLQKIAAQYPQKENDTEYQLLCHRFQNL